MVSDSRGDVSTSLDMTVEGVDMTVEGVDMAVEGLERVSDQAVLLRRHCHSPMNAVIK